MAPFFGVVFYFRNHPEYSFFTESEQWWTDIAGKFTRQLFGGQMIDQGISNFLSDAFHKTDHAFLKHGIASFIIENAIDDHEIIGEAQLQDCGQVRD